jgi:hypothetical protein
LGRKIQWGLLIALLVGSVVAVWCLGCSKATTPGEEKSMSGASWLLARDEEYQGRREHGIEVDEVIPESPPHPLWFRFADARDGHWWTCWVYSNRLDAIVNRTESSMDRSLDYDKATYKMPFPMTLTFHYGLTLKIRDVGAQPTPWDGEVFSYKRVNAPSVEDKSCASSL